MAATDMIKRYKQLRASGLSDKQAMAGIGALETMISAVAEKMATKEDVTRLEDKINSIVQNMATKEDITILGKDIDLKFSAFAEKYKLESSGTKLTFILWVLGACALCVIGACFKQYFPWG